MNEPKLLAPILLKIIIRVILISLGLQLEALETYKGYMRDMLTLDLGSPFIAQGVLFYKISIMTIE